MFCPKCGASVSEDMKFCNSCGFTLIKTASQPKQAINQQPINQTQQAAQPVTFAPKKKKKHIGLWITLAVLLIIVLILTWFLGNLFFFKPKDLGVNYTDANYTSAMEKTGIQIVFDGKSGKELEDYKASLGSKKLDIDDYNWEFTNYQHKTFKLTPAEASALLDNIAPNFWWFDDVQVNILPDGTMEGSSKADVAGLKKDLFSDVADQIPIPLPDTVNIYSKGTISIKDNVLTGDPEVFQVGTISLPEEYMTDESISVIADYFERIYTIIPDMKINSLTADKDGNFVFDGVIPQSIKATSKN